MKTWHGIGFAVALLLVTEVASARQYIGCYVDKSTRDLPSAFISRGAMNVGQCVAHCRTNGFRFAGLQFSNQCFCGNSYGRYGRVPDQQCRMGCAGNRRQKCGSSWRNSVYRVGGPLKPPINTRAGYLGCFKDTSQRDLPSAFVSRGTMNVGQCKSHCQKGGFRFAGVQYGRQCFCGNTHGRYGRVPEHKCNMRCAGNRNQTCGGSWHNNIYRIGRAAPPPPPPPPPSAPPPTTGRGYIGCFKDKPKRDLPSAFISRGTMNVRQCRVHCRQSGFRFAGVQFARQCFCGNAYGRYGRAPERKCNMSCAGNRGQKCGGSWHNTIYKTGRKGFTPPYRPPAGQSGFVGCYKDKPRRDLPYAFVSRRTMSVGQCKAHCRAKGYRFAGAQFSKQCFCGNSYGRYGKAPYRECNMSCSGDVRQKCGGSWRNSVYRLR